ncbi:MAG: acetyl-CoA carboxylase biotin carboxylase subunit [Deltaproteobacteria bacterium]|nr:acetyl-CoA carboxylase biotin carboxylase subunit [Deltaproteobacteria bacterium]
MFSKVLVANRGEIAVRVIRACRELGVASAAIFSEADAGAPHVRLADEAHPCGPAPARESYLDGERILRIATSCGADAIHPGYGFLSENADFAEACVAAGLVFIGPSSDVMRRMGDKVQARRAMQAAGMPIVPGATERLTDEAFAARCEQIGYPVMVKASAGGGGKGLRRVESADDLAKALPRARSESESAFGDGGLYVEKWLESPRHIEIQVLADAYGNTLHCFERECSIQRRHQKLVEEAPAPQLTEGLRARMAEAAIKATKAIGYQSAGTFEFLVDSDDQFFFLEMNTRIQVEHAVTEAITGIDLVKEMIRIAAGEPLTIRQDDLSIRGHAIEARIYAENPQKGFLPSPGPIERWHEPEGPGVRVDSGVEAGNQVTIHYDPLLAKLVVWGRDRDEAVARLAQAVDEFEVEGIYTSLAFHRQLVQHPVFLNGNYDTGFIGEHMKPPKKEKKAR